MQKTSKIRPDDLAAISERLRALRATTGLSQQAFAAEFGFSYSQWANFESEKNRIGIDAALVLTTGRLRVPLDWIYLGQEDWLPAGLRDKIKIALENPAPRRAPRKKSA